MRFTYGIMIIFLCLGWFAWSENSVTFWKVLLKHPKEVAAFSPCSNAVAKEISSIIEHNGKPLRILEVGGGTGALTSGIVKQMQSGDICDVIELMPTYCEILKERFEKFPGVAIHCCSILDWHPEEPYDIIICSLPFNTFEVQFVDAVLNHLKKCIKPHGRMSYVELLWVSELKKHFISQQARNKLIQTMDHMKKFRSTYGKKTVPIYWNFTPLAVHHLEIA